MTITKEASGFVRHLHAFRGFAIINIVAVHAFAVPFLFLTEGREESLTTQALYSLTETAFHSSTLYFALISGLLFSIVLKARGWMNFFRGKLTNVLLPYVIITLFFSFYHWTVPFTQPVFPESLGGYLTSSLHNIFTGEAIFYLWYIPVLAILFALTPLISAILHNKSLSWLIWPIVLGPLVVSRTWPGISVGDVIYFFEVCLVKVRCASDKRSGCGHRSVRGNRVGS